MIFSENRFPLFRIMLKISTNQSMSENCSLPLAIDAGAPSNTRVVRRGLQVRKPRNLAAPHEKGGLWPPLFAVSPGGFLQPMRAAISPA